MRRLVGLVGVGLLATACMDATAPTDRLAAPAAAARNVAGAVNTNFYAGGSCTGVNGNIYPDQYTVGLNGSPSDLGAGPWWVLVEVPGGNPGEPFVPLGASAGATFTGDCAQLWSLVKSASSGYTATGFDATTNPGGEYRVVLSATGDFVNGERKSDNFKIRRYLPPTECNPEVEVCGPPDPFSLLSVDKFYDANLDGVRQAETEPLIPGWKINVTVAGLASDELTPFGTMVAVGDEYSVFEYMPTQANWHRSAPAVVPVTGTATAADLTILFGNFCTGSGGGRTLGFWSNKNGAKALTPGVIGAVLALNLRKGNGIKLGVASVGGFQKYLLEGNATNMAYMLSVQLAAMQANVSSGGVVGAHLIYAPGTNSANPLGYASATDVITEANALLGTGDASPLLILSGSPLRPRAEALKTALDRANQDNSTTFVQTSPCAFTFAD